jgi:ribosomal protein L37AE/L43A
MSRLWQITHKATASSVNVAVVFVLTGPVYLAAGVEWWRGSCIVLFFSYNLALSHRCFGQMIARTRQNLPTNPAYAALYTASFSTLLFWAWFPLDVALANGLFVQLPCLMLYGNTLHGLATGRKTMTEAEYQFECIALRGQCPDCQRVTLEANGAIIHCRSCHAAFYAGSFYVRRVQLQDGILSTADVIDTDRFIKNAPMAGSHRGR